VHLGICLHLVLVNLANSGIVIVKVELGGCKQSCIDNRALLDGHAVGFEVRFHRLKDLLPEVVRIKEMVKLRIMVSSGTLWLINSMS
jgi:hypothetical protein